MKCPLLHLMFSKIFDFYFVFLLFCDNIFFMNKYDINSLNEEQKQALYSTDGVVLVTAGAGSGKTRLLTHRICYLLMEKHVSPYNILAITFTNKATNEMKERVREMCNLNVWISTFHSMCVRILRQEIDFLDGYDKNFTIISETDRDRIIKEICKELELEDDDISKIEHHIDNIKNSGAEIEEYFMELMRYGNENTLKKYMSAVYKYEENLRKNNSLDFDDLLNKTLFLFQNYPEVLNRYANRFQYVLVDEFQDTNLVQYKLIKMLVSVHKNLFVVGDEDQCIYSWRGANFHNIFNLKKDFDNVNVFKLERNYRSSKNILNLANNVISNNKERMEKKLWTEKEDGLPPVVYSAFDERDEALFIANEIEKLCDEGYSYSDFAVLMRLNALSRPIEEGLLSYNIPYRVFGGQKFFERAEIKILLAYISIFVNPKDEISLLKVINFPKRGIGDVAIANLKSEAEDGILEYLLSEKFKYSKYYKKLENFVETYRKLREELNVLSLYNFAKKLIKDFHIDIEYAGKDEESINRMRNIDSFLSSIKEFEAENENATFSDYLAGVMLRSDQDEINEDGYVSVSTIHAVKGLEFRVVFVIGLEEGIFPLSRAMNSLGEMEEERRLMYVAITRAEEKIYLTYATKRYMYGKSNYETDSRFLKELGIVDKKLPKAETKKSKDFLVEEKEEEQFNSGLKVGDVVFHNRFGEGEVLDISSDGMVGKIDFSGSIKELMLNMAKLEKLEEKDE